MSERIVDFLIEENKALRKAGGDLAIAAAHVVHESDGIHRLGLALAAWHKALADEGGRGSIRPFESSNVGQVEFAGPAE